MYKILIILLLYSFPIFAQVEKEVNYEYGHNGMELVIKKSNVTIIVNTFNAKLNLREDIAEKLYALYLKDSLQTNSHISIIGDEAKVTGKVIIEQKDSLTSISFYFEKVEWNSGKIEVYKKPE